MHHEQIIFSEFSLYELVGQITGIQFKEEDETANLFEQGIDSIQMMTIVGRLRSLGYSITFADFIGKPTLKDWKSLIAHQASKSESLVSLVLNDELPLMVDQENPFELALMQHAYWVGRNDGQYLGGVAAHFYNEFDGDNIDSERLEAAVYNLLLRHGMLRVCIMDDGRQQIPKEPNWAGLKIHDLRQLSASDAELRLEEIRESLSHRHMNISHGEVFDVQLSLFPDELKPQGARVHVNLDMIAADALSLRTLLKDLAHFYQNGSEALPALQFNYPSYLAEKRKQQKKKDRLKLVEDARNYWQTRLPRLPGAPTLPVAYGHVQDAKRVVRRHHWLNEKDRCQIEAKASEHCLTLAMVFAAVLCETLNQYSAEQKFLLNLPLFDRENLHPDADKLVGDFSSSILLEWDGATPGTFFERTQRLQAQFHQDAIYASYSGVEVLRDASRLRGEPLYAPVVFTSALGLGDLFGEQVRQTFGDVSWIISEGPQVWLDCQVTELNGGLLVNWDAREAAFAPGMLDDMFQQFISLVNRLVVDGHAWKEVVSFKLPNSQVETRLKVNDTEAPVSTARLHDGFFKHAIEYPEAPAFFWGSDGSLSYGALAQKALQLASFLEKEGVSSGDLVAISLPKGPEQVVAILGVLAVGAAYLPLNIDQPPSRRERILSISAVKYLVDDLSMIDGTPPLVGPKASVSSDLAYVLYTSGSTGEPKGVELTHRAAMNTIEDLNERFEITAKDRTLAVSSYDFDLSVFDIFSPLSVGGSIVCLDESERREAAAWVNWMNIHGVTVLNCVPALADMLCTVAQQIPSLRLVLLGGDWVPLTLPVQLQKISPGCRCIVLGGTTETAIHSTIQEVLDISENWVSIPYGVPLRNVKCRVVDGQGNDRPDYVPGELWIGGEGVAKGYRGDPARTKDRFVIFDNQRWYRTGDMARYMPDGSIEFLGRMDHQVKVRGHRIELGEVEASLTSHPNVAQGVAVLSKHKQLAAAITLKPNAQLSVEALHEYLKQQIPEYMVPQQIVVLDALPLSENGKIDRRSVIQLIEDIIANSEEMLSSPEGELEVKTAAVWQSVLGVSNIGREHNFFNLGGDSLQATRLITLLRDEGFVDVTLTQLFNNPTLMDFAKCLHQRKINTTDITVTPALDHRYLPFPATDVQRAYLVGRREGFTLGGVGCYYYREFEVENLDVVQLEAAVNKLIERHEMLRAVFDGEGNQKILPTVERFKVLVTEAGADSKAALDKMRREASQRLFDPKVWPLFSIDVVRNVAGKSQVARIGIGVDNLILDALSIMRFYEELGLLYNDLDTTLPSVELSFRDYVIQALPDASNQEKNWEYWRNQLKTMPPAPQLPLAVDPSTIKKPIFVRREYLVKEDSWKKIHAKARGYGLTPSAILLNAYAQVLGRWSARPDLTINLTLFDRKEVHPDINNVMGDFTSLILVSSHPDSHENWVDSCKRIQSQLWGALDHRDVSAVQVLRELALRESDLEMTMPVVFTSALGVTSGGDGKHQNKAKQALPFNESIWGLSQTPQVWLDQHVTEFAGGICVTWDAVEDLFPKGMLDAMFEAYKVLLGWMAEESWARSTPDLLPLSQKKTRLSVNKTEGKMRYQALQTDFFKLAKEKPERIALLWSTEVGECQLSYGELADKALRVARQLKEKGVGVGELVAITLPRGPLQVIAVLAILAVGATYVPIGIAQPQARQERIHQIAGIGCVIMDDDGLDKSSANELSVDKVEFISIEKALSKSPLSEIVPVVPEALAYVIFTSGSTGEPKGVEISHRAALNTIDDINFRCDLKESDRLLAVSALDFDLSVYDLFGPLSVGGAIVLLDENSRREAPVWLDLVQRMNVTVWNSVPALLEMLLITAEQTAQLESLRAVLVSGDWVGLDLPGRVARSCPSCRFLVLGGATEASIWSNIFEVTQVDSGWKSIPYGVPLRNQQFRVVNASGLDCPDWVTGELWIGGEGVAKGYCGQAELTSSRFVTYQGLRWYRTGDVGRYWPDGLLEFLGRADHQVKLRGHRIELGEIEAALKQIPGVKQAVAAIIGEGGARRIVAAVVPESEADSAVSKTQESDNKLDEIILADRRVAFEVEAKAVEYVLVKLFELPDFLKTSKSLKDLSQKFEIAEINKPVFKLWLDWLVQRNVLIVNKQEIQAGSRFIEALESPLCELEKSFMYQGPYIALVAKAQKRLLECLDKYRGILAGHLDSIVLYDDDVLSPNYLSTQDPGTIAGIEKVAVEVKKMRQLLGRPVKIVEPDGRGGVVAAMLLRQLDPDDVRYTLLDTAPSMVAKASKLLGAFPHQTACETRPENDIPDAFQYQFDLVLNVNSFHRYYSPKQGPLLTKLLAQHGGKVIVLERSDLTPMGIVTAALLENGYSNLDHHSYLAGHPMLPGKQWAHWLADAGWYETSYQMIGNTFCEWAEASRSSNEIALSSDEMNQQLIHVLPDYMVPERMRILPWLPLSANGKVDRKAIAEKFDTSIEGKVEEVPLDGMEHAVANIWRELLAVPLVYRDQSFFQLGGDSLLATRFLAAIKHDLGIDFPLGKLFSKPKLRDVAQALEQESFSTDEKVEMMEYGEL